MNTNRPENGNPLRSGLALPGEWNLWSFLFSGRRRPVIVVSGLPRSGTSLMMKMLSAAGCDLLTDQVRQGDEFNPNGYFEFESVKRLKEGDHAWLGQAAGKVVKVVSPLLQYLPAQYTYQVIFMQRDLGEVLASQSRMMTGLSKTAAPEDDHRLAQAYSDHLGRVREWMARQGNIKVHYASYNQLLASPRAVIEPVAHFLGRPVDVDRMQAVVDPRLYRNRASATESRPAPAP